MINSCQLIYVLVLFTFFSSYSMQPVEVIDEEDHKMKTLEDSVGRTSNLIDKKEKNSGKSMVMFQISSTYHVVYMKSL